MSIKQSVCNTKHGNIMSLDASVKSKIIGVLSNVVIITVVLT